MSPCNLLWYQCLSLTKLPSNRKQPFYSAHRVGPEIQTEAHDKWGLDWMTDSGAASLTHHVASPCGRASSPELSPWQSLSLLTSVLNTSSPSCHQLSLRLACPAPGFLHLSLNVLCLEKLPGPAGPSASAACAPACSWHLSQQWTPISCCCLSFCTGSSVRARMGLRVTPGAGAWPTAHRLNGWMSSRQHRVYSSAWCSHIHVGSQLCSLGHVTCDPLEPQFPVAR